MPSVREVSNLCSYAQKIFKSALDAISAKRSKKSGSKFMPKDHWVLAYHRFLSPEKTSEEVGMEHLVRDWKFDYEEFLNVFFSQYMEYQDYEVAMRTTFVKIFASDHSYLEDLKGGKFSFNDVEEDDLLTDIPADDDNYKEHLEARTSDFQRWIIGVYNSISYFFSPVKTTAEERKFLLKTGIKNLYERAEREMQLGNITYERRIALNDIIGNSKNLTEESIDETLDLLRKTLAHRLEKLKYLAEKAGEGSKKSKVFRIQEQLVRKARYSIRAIKVNRRWIKRILGIES